MKPYNGGKSGNGTYQAIINKIPPHKIYIEPFAGHAGIFRKIRRAPLSILNDIDNEVIQDLLLDYFKKKIIKKTVLVGLDYIQGDLYEKPPKPVIILRNHDYQVIFERFGNNIDSFIYCDPPYPMQTRLSKNRIYKYDWDNEAQHIIFLEQVLLCKSNIMISSYPNDLYNDILKNWNTYKFYSTTRSGKKAEEIIYMNYEPPVILHDFRYLGNNFRERGWLKIKINRQLNKLKGLPDIERMAILSAIMQEYKTTNEKLIKL